MPIKLSNICLFIVIESNIYSVIHSRESSPMGNDRSTLQPPNSLKKDLGFSPGSLKRNHKFTKVIVILFILLGFLELNVQRSYNIRCLTLERDDIEEALGS